MKVDRVADKLADMAAEKNGQHGVGHGGQQCGRFGVPHSGRNKQKIIGRHGDGHCFFFVSAKTKWATLSATMFNSMQAIFVMVADMEVDKVADIVAGLRIFFKSLKALQVNF